MKIKAGIDPESNPKGLTDREQDVLRLLMQGKTDPEIAASLKIGLRTVETHVQRILEKYHVSNRCKVALLAHGIDVDLD